MKNSPFAFFRKYQRVGMVALTVMAMFSFVFLGTMTGNSGGNARASGDVAVKISGGNLTAGDLEHLRYERVKINEFISRIIVVSATADEENKVPEWQLSQLVQNNLFGIEWRPYPFESDVNLIWGQVMRLEAKRLGLVVTDPMVTSHIDRLTGKKLTPTQFREILLSLQLREKDIYDMFRSEMLARNAWMITHPMSDHTPEQYWKYYRQMKVRQNLEVAALPISEFAKTIKDPGDAVLEPFFQQYRLKFPGQYPNQADPGFRQPAKVRVQYLTASYEEVEKKVPPISDKEVAEFYEKNKDTLYREQEKPDTTKIGDNDPLNPDLAPEIPPPPALPETIDPAAETPAKDAPKDQPAEKPADAPKDKPAEKPAEDKPAEKPAEDKKPAEEAKPEKPCQDQPAADKEPAAEKPAAEKPAETKPEVKKAAATEDKPAAAKPAETKPTDKPAETKPAAGAPAEKPAGEKPATAKPGTDAPALEKPEALPVKYQPLTEELKENIREELLRQKTQEALKKIGTDTLAELDGRNLRYNMPVAIADHMAYIDFNEDGKLDTDEPSVESKTKFNPDEQDKVPTEVSAALKEKVTKIAAADMQAVGKKLGMKYSATGLISVEELDATPGLGKVIDEGDNPFQPGGAGRIRNVLFGKEILFNPEIGKDSDLDGQDIYVYWKTELVKTHVPQFTDPGIREQVLAAWKKQEAYPLAVKRAGELVKLAGGKSKLEVALKDQTVTSDKSGLPVLVHETADFSWRSPGIPSPQSQDTPPPVLSTVAFVEEPGDEFMQVACEDLGIGEAGFAPNRDHTYVYVMRVINRDPKPGEETERMRETFLKDRVFSMNLGFFSLSSVYSHIASEDATLLIMDWMEGLKDEYDISYTDEEKVF